MIQKINKIVVLKQCSSCFFFLNLSKPPSELNKNWDFCQILRIMKHSKIKYVQQNFYSQTQNAYLNPEKHLGHSHAKLRSKGIKYKTPNIIVQRITLIFWSKDKRNINL